MTVTVHWRTYFKASFLIWNGCTLVALCCLIIQVSVREHFFSFRSCHWTVLPLSLHEAAHCLLIFISYLEDKASTHADYMINLKSMKADWTHLKKISRSHWNAQTGQTASHDVLWIETTTMAWMNVCKRCRKYICISLSVYITDQHLCTEASMVLFVYALQLQE